MFFMICGMIMCAIGLFGLMAFDTNTAEFVLFACAGFLTFLAGLGVFKRKDKCETKQNTSEEMKSQLSLHEKEALEFYDECVDRKIVIDNAVQPEAKRLMANKYGIEESEVDGLFEEGREIKQKQEIEAAQKAAKKQAENEKKLFEQEKEKASVYGKDKYLVMLRNKLLQQQKVVSSANDRVTRNSENMVYVAKHKDPTVSAAWYSSVAGTAAGISQANKVAEENRWRDELAADFRQSAKKIHSSLVNDANNASAYLRHLQERKKNIEDRLVDDSDPFEKLTLITFLETTFDRPKESKDNTIDVKIKIKVAKPRLLNRDAILDGSLKIDLHNESGEVVASGIYNAPGYGEYYLNNVGFNKVKTIKVRCFPTENYSEPRDSEQLYPEITPIHLWLIEGRQYSDSEMARLILRCLKKYGYVRVTCGETYCDVPELHEISPRQINRLLRKMRWDYGLECKFGYEWVTWSLK